MAASLDLDLSSIQEARRLVEQACQAQKEFARYTQGDIDRLVGAMARVGEAAASELAKLAYEETGFGVLEHKVFKNIFNSKHLWHSIENAKTVGVIYHDSDRKVVGIGEPVGVIAALVPVTHPTATVYFNAITALKCGNAIVFSPHPRSPRSSSAAARVMAKAIEALGAPPGLVACMEQVSMEGTNELLRHPGVSLVLGTGGAAMVRAAYSSGKPSIAVGPGNVPAYVDRSCRDIPRTVKNIIISKTFDNGTPCASEQATVADAPVSRALREELAKQGAYFLNPQEKAALGRAVSLPGRGFMVNPEAVGQSPQTLGRLAGFPVPPDCRLLVAELDKVGPAEPLSAEILSTVLAFYTVDGWEEGARLCNELLEFGGVGHTCAIHSQDQGIIAKFGARVKAFRVVVNCPSVFGAMGLVSGLTTSFMLGTGTWGGSITSDNVSIQHLINIKRIAYESRDFGEAI